MNRLALAAALSLALAYLSLPLGILFAAIFVVGFLVPGFAFFHRTSSTRTFNVASFHSPHSLTWSWILLVSHQRATFVAPHFSWGRSNEFHRIYGASIGSFANVFATRNNNGWQFGLCLLGLSVSWSRQQPMFYRDMMRRDWSRGYEVAALIFALFLFAPLFVGSAFAADDTTVQFAPWVAFLKPYLDLLVQALITLVIIPLVSYAIYRLTGIQIDRRYSDQLTKLFTNGAANLVAQGAVKISAQGVDVHSDLLKTEADKAIAFAPNAVKWFGLSPQTVADRIIAKIPQLPPTPATTPSTGV